MTRFRVSAHRLETESGRWHKPQKNPYNDRKCQLCNVLEDEFHFLLECPLYSDLRKNYIKKRYWQNPNILKFIDLMKSTEKKSIPKLATYVFKSFEKRNTTLYM